MSFLKLYNAAQKIDGKISTNWLTDNAIALSDFTRIKEQWSGVMDPLFMQGFFIEGPLSPPVSLAENEGLIVLARGMDKHRRRFVYTKELMHVFDLPEEKADTPQKFDTQAEKFCDPSTTMSPQFRAEAKAFWRAVAILCPEKRRLEFKQQLVDGKTSLVVVATALQIPSSIARHLFRDDFADVLKHIKQK
jgi:hypothetical protein